MNGSASGWGCPLPVGFELSSGVVAGSVGARCLRLVLDFLAMGGSVGGWSTLGGSRSAPLPAAPGPICGRSFMLSSVPDEYSESSTRPADVVEHAWCDGEDISVLSSCFLVGEHRPSTGMSPTPGTLAASIVIVRNQACQDLVSPSSGAGASLRCGYRSGTREPFSMSWIFPVSRLRAPP